MQKTKHTHSPEACAERVVGLMVDCTEELMEHGNTNYPCNTCSGTGKVLRFPGLSYECLCVKQDGPITTHVRECDRKTGRIPNISLETLLDALEQEGKSKVYMEATIDYVRLVAMPRTTNEDFYGNTRTDAALRALCEATMEEEDDD